MKAMKFLAAAALFGAALSAANLPAQEGVIWPFVNSQGRFVYCDAEGRPLINEEFSKGRPFLNGQAVVKNREGQIGVIDRSGQYIFKGGFKEVYAEGVKPEAFFYEATSVKTKVRKKWTVLGTMTDTDFFYTLKYFDSTGRSFYSFGPYDEHAAEPPRVLTLGRRVFFQKGSACEVFEQGSDRRIKKLRNLKSVEVILDENTWLKNSGEKKLRLCQVETGDCDGPVYEILNDDPFVTDYRGHRVWRYSGLDLKTAGDDQHTYTTYGDGRGLVKRPLNFEIAAGTLDPGQLRAFRDLAGPEATILRIATYSDGAAIVYTREEYAIDPESEASAHVISHTDKGIRKEAYFLSPGGAAGRRDGDDAQVSQPAPSSIAPSPPEAVRLPRADRYYYKSGDCLVFSGGSQCGVLNLAGGGYHVPPTRRCGLEWLTRADRLIRSDNDPPSWSHQLVTYHGEPLSKSYGTMRSTSDKNLLEIVPQDSPTGRSFYMLTKDGRELVLAD